MTTNQRPLALIIVQSLVQNGCRAENTDLKVSENTLNITSLFPTSFSDCGSFVDSFQRLTQKVLLLLGVVGRVCVERDVVITAVLSCGSH